MTKVYDASCPHISQSERQSEKDMIIIMISEQLNASPFKNKKKKKKALAYWICNRNRNFITIVPFLLYLILIHHFPLPVLSSSNITEKEDQENQSHAHTISEIEENNESIEYDDEQFAIKEKDYECVSLRMSESPLPLDKIHEKQKNRVNSYLNEIHNISNGTAGICSSPTDTYKILPGLPINITESFKLPKELADLIAYFMYNLNLGDKDAEAYKIVMNHIGSLFLEPTVEDARFVEIKIKNPVQKAFRLFDRNGRSILKINENELRIFPWYITEDVDLEKFNTEHQTDYNSPTNAHRIGYWTWPYFKCNHKEDESNQHHNDGIEPRSWNNMPGMPGKWMISYSVFFTLLDKKSYGVLSFDVDLSHFPIRQCDFDVNNEDDKSCRMKGEPLVAFRGTHKCDRKTTICHHVKNDRIGWYKGDYICICKPNHHAHWKEWNNTIPGYYLETKWCTTELNSKINSNNNNPSSTTNGTTRLEEIASCRACPMGCPECNEKKSCLAESSYALRVSLMAISIICCIGTFVIIIAVYNCRKRPIFSVSSPLFLCITLLGCIIMYTEMVVLFPVLSTPYCIAVKWTRHLGFCVTYTALYMKLCRVYLTFRVKSAHKIKLTEKHLLHWMSPIMVIMLLYLLAWTISDPPNVEIMKTTDGKRFYQCVYNWWDHALAIGEVIFLAYGVWICWRIRDNQDAQFISYSIYNIALVNVLMVSFHLIIFPKASPDMKYFLAFMRTQMSTTVTIGLVLGSKLYRSYQGQVPGKEIANSSNGFGKDNLDLDEENIQLKEELQKMATQIERLRSYAMCKNNPHLKHSNANLPLPPPPDSELGKTDPNTLSSSL